MFKNFLQYCELKKTNVFEFIPLTFVLEVDSVNYAFDLDKFIQYYSFIEKAIEVTGIVAEKLEKDLEAQEVLLT